MGSKQGGNTTVTANNIPAQQSFVLPAFQQAQSSILNTPQQYFPGQTVAGFNPLQQTAQTNIANLGLNGQPVTNAANKNVTDTLNGSFLNSNPYLQGAINNASQGIVRNFQSAIAPGIDSAFEQAGRYGSGAQGQAQSVAQQNLAQELGNVASGMSSADYANERQLQNQAALLAPQLANQNFTNLGQALNVGGQQQQQSQADINAQIAKFNFGQQEPYNRIGAYLNMVGGTPAGGMQSQQTPYFTNPTGNILGGIGAGASLFNGLNQSGLFSSIGSGLNSLFA